MTQNPPDPGQYADEHPVERKTMPTRGTSIAIGVVSVIGMIVLGIAQLAWLGRPEEIADLAVTMVGPFLGVIIGTAIGAGRRRKAPRAHPLWWHAGLAAVLLVAWLLLVTGVGGGFSSDMIAPTAVLGVIGAAGLVALTKLLTPELISD